MRKNISCNFILDWDSFSMNWPWCGLILHKDHRPLPPLPLGMALEPLQNFPLTLRFPNGSALCKMKMALPFKKIQWQFQDCILKPSRNNLAIAVQPNTGKPVTKVQACFWLGTANRPYNAHDVRSVGPSHLRVKRRLFIGQSCAPLVQICAFLLFCHRFTSKMAAGCSNKVYTKGNCLALVLQEQSICNNPLLNVFAGCFSGW